MNEMILIAAGVERKGQATQHVDCRNQVRESNNAKVVVSQCNLFVYFML